MSVLYLTEDDVRRLMDVRLAVDLVEEAFRQLAAGQADNVPRVRAAAPGFVLHSMSAAAPYLGAAAWKCYTTTREGARFHVGLYDLATGRLAALIEADHLGRLRTGAATAVAVEWMAVPEVHELGLFGAGRQARTQLAAVCVARPIQRAYVYSRNAERCLKFAAETSQELGIEVTAVDRPQEAAEDLPLVISATSSAAPVFDGALLAEGALVCAVGSNWPNRAEIDSTVIRRADNIVCDSVRACRSEAGDFADALERGIFDWSRAVDLCEVVAGRAVGRNTPQSIGLFKSVGLAIEDLALAAKLVELARAEGAGKELPIG
jgi:ornithine cyclodeaminase/alanine dehydrogenase